VADLEARIAPITAALSDPALYTRRDGAATAHQLGLELEALKRELEAALARWEQATQQVEALSGET
ncbi:MAG TPA: ABC transporter C-terminal domain-containing protein, partial [Gemmatimonadales bacterium]|nr:ABC transporter C-terminal domain-containing protein [Gemmatimonadales bacterium]